MGAGRVALAGPLKRYGVKVRHGADARDHDMYEPFVEVRTAPRELRTASTAVFLQVGDGGWSRAPNERGTWILRPRSTASPAPRYFSGASEDLRDLALDQQLPSKPRALPSELHFTWNVEKLPEFEERSLATARASNDSQSGWPAQQFRSDPDFAAYLGDTDFAALLIRGAQL
jgi:hypothetical protein